MTSNTDPHKQKQNTKQRKLNDKQHGPPSNTKLPNFVFDNKENKNEKQHDPPQTKTKHTTEKTKMISNTTPHKQKQNTTHRKLK